VFLFLLATNTYAWRLFGKEYSGTEREAVGEAYCGEGGFGEIVEVTKYFLGIPVKRTYEVICYN